MSRKGGHQFTEDDYYDEEDDYYEEDEPADNWEDEYDDHVTTKGKVRRARAATARPR